MNRLSLETSPYLQQHAANPVWWYSWGEEALEAARQQQKPIFLSIGYSTCYWCHVMEKDSFEQQEVADVLNENFISIKVDREERPDVDKIYMDTVVALTGHGGWPLSAALIPDGKPFWAGTFFYKDQFIQVLKALSRAWQTEREKVLESASEITAEIFKETQSAKDSPLSAEPIEKAVAALARGFDSTNGGFGAAPKFPPPFQLGLLLRYAHSTSDKIRAKAANDMVKKTLDCMIDSGIHDQIGGGFHRYATDQAWLVPHFEKMLYDNAHLCHVLCEAYQVFADDKFLETAKGIAEYVLRDLRDPEGAFYSAQDAGEVGKEGEYYVFTLSELRTNLALEDFETTRKIFQLSEAGNFEHNTNIFARPTGLRAQDWLESGAARRSILYLRQKRDAPSVDTKILTGWNALMIRGLVKLAEISGDQSYLQAAGKAASFIAANLWESNQLYRSYVDGRVKIIACLEDYAFLIEALLDLFCVGGEERWFQLALSLQKAQEEKLWAQDKGCFYDSQDSALISRKIDFTDGATAAGNSVAAKNALFFARLTATRRYEEQAVSILQNFSDSLEHYPHGATRALQSLHLYLNPPSEVVLVYDAMKEKLTLPDRLSRMFLPTSIVVRWPQGDPSELKLQALLSGKSAAADEPLVYACRSHECSAPTKLSELVGV